MKPIKIDRYEIRLIKGIPQTFAIAGKHEYPMPSAFASMYDDSHLAIEQVSNPRPEMFDIKEDAYYVPLRTA